MSILDAARANWRELPYWLEVMATECDLTSQSQVAKKLGYSSSVVSQVLKGPEEYRGSLEAVEDRVRGALMNEEIDCLGMGVINKRDCRDWRERWRKTKVTNSHSITMYRACNRCPVNVKGREDEQV